MTPMTMEFVGQSHVGTSEAPLLHDKGDLGVMVLLEMQMHDLLDDDGRRFLVVYEVAADRQSRFVLVAVEAAEEAVYDLQKPHFHSGMTLEGLNNALVVQLDR